MKKRVPSLSAAAVATAMIASQALAQEEPAEYAEPSMEEMMAAMMAAGAPGEMHELLARTVGEWDFTLEMKASMGPTGPLTMEGTSTSEMMMDGRFVAERVESTFMGQPFQGLGITGYDNTSGRFQAIWIDNMTTHLYTYAGQMEGDAIEMTGTYVDPMTGEEVAQRSVLTFIDDDRYKVENYETRGGVENLTMTLHYTRRD